MEFTETARFSKSADRLLSDESLMNLQFDLTVRPEAGVIIPRSGGLRKIRWALPGRGKSGGVRVIYYWLMEDSKILLCGLYPKNEKANVSPAELDEFRKEMEEWKK